MNNIKLSIAFAMDTKLDKKSIYLMKKQVYLMLRITSIKKKKP